MSSAATHFPAAAAGAAALFALCLTGCLTPTDPNAENQLRQRLIASHQAYLQSAAGAPNIERKHTPGDVEEGLTPERRAELEKLSGKPAYEGVAPDLGADLMGQEPGQAPTVGLSLRRALVLGAMNNLDLRQARLVPAISETQVVQAAAAFDAIYFAQTEYDSLNQPRPASSFGSLFGGPQRTDTLSLTTGVRKQLSSGAQVKIQTDFSRLFTIPTFFNTNPYHTADITLGIAQPLLRNFGRDVNRSQITLAESAQKQSADDLYKDLLDVTAATEAAYWRLVQVRQELLIRQRLLQMTIETRDRLKNRGDVDVSPVKLTEANSFVESHRFDVIQARQNVRLASDQLKRLINAPDLPMAGEELIEPLDAPADLPVNVNLLDAVSTALRRRPELQKALAQIKDASVRQSVADNLRLPSLNVSATLRFNGEDGHLGGAYANVPDGRFIDYLLGLQFEMPIGNRAAEGLYRQRQVERQAFTVAYQNAAQGAVLEVKSAMRNMLTAYELIGAARSKRLATSESLRAIQKMEEAGVATTPEFLDLKLQSQERMADAEIKESTALSDYATAIANFYKALGTLLDQDGIALAEPDRSKP